MTSARAELRPAILASNIARTFRHLGGVLATDPLPKLPRRRRNPGQINLQRRSPTDLTIDPHPATRTRDDLIDDHQSEPRSPIALGREERFEGIEPGHLVHADAAVADVDCDIRRTFVIF